MFFKHIIYNAAKQRKNNGLFFCALVTAIVTFYALLSLGEQDVMIFLSVLEGPAVAYVMNSIPLIYIASLLFVFFLVYVAYRYQLDNRRKELALYVMFGMRRRKIFWLFMCEAIWNSMISLFIGLPSGVLLTEVISLTTAKIVGLGFVGHQFSFTWTAVFWTVVGIMFVQKVAMFTLIMSFAKQDPVDLLKCDAPKKQIIVSKEANKKDVVNGTMFLGVAYIISLTTIKMFGVFSMAVSTVLGITGTFLMCRGFSVFINKRSQQKNKTDDKLSIFSRRQIQENVIAEHKSIAMCCVLLVFAIGGISYGFGLAANTSTISPRTVDASISGDDEVILRTLNNDENRAFVADYYKVVVQEMRLGTRPKPSQDETGHDVQLTELVRVLETLVENDERDALIGHFENRMPSYVIPVTSYNKLRGHAGKRPVQLNNQQVALYVGQGGFLSNFQDTLRAALQRGVEMTIDDETYAMLPELYSDNLSADQRILWGGAFIVSDDNYEKWSYVDGNQQSFWNIALDEKFVNENGVVPALQLFEDRLQAQGIVQRKHAFFNPTGKRPLVYESYLNEISRALFYDVSMSYLTLYLGMLFLIIGNTVIGLKYLMHQRTSKQRYVTLLLLGAEVSDVLTSVRGQIRLFFSLVLSVAVCSGFVAMWTLFHGLLRVEGAQERAFVATVMSTMFILFALVELVYIIIIERQSKRTIEALQIIERR